MPRSSQQLLDQARRRASNNGFGCFSYKPERKRRIDQVPFVEVTDGNGRTFRFSTDENDNLFVDILTEGGWQRGETYNYYEGQSVFFLFEAQKLKITATREYVGEGANRLCRWSFSSQVIASEDISGINIES